MFYLIFPSKLRWIFSYLCLVILKHANRLICGYFFTWLIINLTHEKWTTILFDMFCLICLIKSVEMKIIYFKYTVTVLRVCPWLSFSACGEPIFTKLLQYVLLENSDNKSEADFWISLFVLIYEPSNLRF